MTETSASSGDNPIVSSLEDRLHRASVAHEFARSLRRSNASQGLVVGVLGPWGSGKSSFINLMREELVRDPEYTVIDFNPWMFSGTQQLVEFFFAELAAELRLRKKGRFDAIADGLEQYGGLLSPLAMVPGIGAWADRSIKAAQTATKFIADRSGSALSLRSKVADSLTKLEQPIVIVVDDIDRLNTDEIRDIFKLVRLTASFPNLIYVVAFDRERVERALGESNVPGRAYLEKIIQLPFDLPAPPSGVLRTAVIDELNRVFSDLGDVRFNSKRWPDVFVEILDPFLTNLRDVTRFALSARSTLEALGQEIEVVDLIALETLRIFRPELHAALKPLAAVLTTPSGLNTQSNPDAKAAIEHLLELAGEDVEAVRSLLRRVFPASRQHFDNYSFGFDSQQRWRRNHEVAHPDFLELYFSRQPSADLLAFRNSERGFAVMSDRTQFGAYLDTVPSEQFESTVQAFEVFDGVYPAGAVVPASIEMFNRITAFPQRESRGMFDFNRPDLVVTRVVLRLFGVLDTEEKRADAANAIFPHLESYSSKLALVELIGHEEGVGHKLVDKSTARAFEERLAGEVTDAALVDPDREWDALRLFFWLSERQGEAFTAPGTRDLALAKRLLVAAQSQTRTQSMGSRALQTEDVLAWDVLVKIFGSEQAIKAAVDGLAQQDPDLPVLALAERYLDGWRPKNFRFDDDDDDE